MTRINASASRFYRWSLNLAIAILAGCATAPTPAPAPTPARIPAPVTAPTPAQAPVPAPTARHCVAQAMYWEARGEGLRGMQAVGSVILNRVADHRFPGTPCGVVHQGGETPPCQFSWWCDGKSDYPTNRTQWATALTVAEQMLTRRPNDATGGALFFHSTAMRNPWQRQQTARIGNHVFYR
ncbi:MAG: cell wall hydrolase [Gammaproteobacteria bacterium]|nr:cell wall hydrolase [Gammaproteobacteria bacterium]